MYDADLAHARARQRLRRTRGGRLLHDAALRAEVAAKLELEWSPEQIAAWLRTTYPHRRDWHVCHETIYHAIYYSGTSGLSRTLSKRLRTGRPLRRRRRRTDARTPRFVAPGQLIHARPAVVETRSRIGDWEGDLIVGRSSRSAIATLVDRTSRFVQLVHLPRGHSAAAVRAALTGAFQLLPPSLRLTLTWDQGSEMAQHDHLADLFRDGVYFALPASPWQRGTNENSNGLLRQYLPKGSDLSIHTAIDLQAIADRLQQPAQKGAGLADAIDCLRSSYGIMTAVTVATITRIHPRTRPSPGGPDSAAVDIIDRRAAQQQLSALSAA